MHSNKILILILILILLCSSDLEELCVHACTPLRADDDARIATGGREQRNTATRTDSVPRDAIDDAVVMDSHGGSGAAGLGRGGVQLIRRWRSLQ